VAGIGARALVASSRNLAAGYATVWPPPACEVPWEDIIRHRAILKSTLVVAAMLAAWVLAAPFLAERLVVARPLDRADVILVLAGSAGYLERTQMAALLFKQHVARKVVLTNDRVQEGWSTQEQRNPLFVELARRALIAQGVPDSAIEIFMPDGSEQ
jgi:hypothetical protein